MSAALCIDLVQVCLFVRLNCFMLHKPTAESLPRLIKKTYITSVPLYWQTLDSLEMACVTVESLTNNEVERHGIT
jgi:hypothetical protein